MGKEVSLMDRDELLGKQIFHRDKAHYYRKKIELIDNQEHKEERLKLVGKCFDININGGMSYREYVMITSLDHQFEPVGTKIEIYGRGKNKNITIALHARIYGFQTERSKPIRKSRFNKYIADFQESLKEKMG